MIPRDEISKTRSDILRDIDAVDDLSPALRNTPKALLTKNILQDQLGAIDLALEALSLGPATSSATTKPI